MDTSGEAQNLVTYKKNWAHRVKTVGLNVNTSCSLISSNYKG